MTYSNDVKVDIMKQMLQMYWEGFPTSKERSHERGELMVDMLDCIVNLPSDDLEYEVLKE